MHLSKIETQVKEKIKHFIHVVYIALIVIIIYLNIKTTTYIFNGWYVFYNETLFKFIFIALLLSVLILSLYKKINFSNKIYEKIFIIIFVLTLILRILLVFSFKLGPAGDAWAYFASGLDLISGKIDSFYVGGYISNFPYQLGGFSFWLPFFYLFKDNFIGYYIINIFLLHFSLLFFVLFVRNLTNYKTGFFASLLLFLFVPNYFYQFLIYNETVGLFVFSIILYILSRNDIKNVKTQILLYLFLIIGVIVRENLLVLLIAVIITIILKKGFKLDNIAKILLLIFIVFSNLFLIKIYDSILETNIASNSMPKEVTLAIGLTSAGYTNKYINFFSNSGNDKAATKELIQNDIKTLLYRYRDINRMKNFIEMKLVYSWTDQDFDSMNYILPFNYEKSSNDFINNNDIRYGRAAYFSSPQNEFGNTIYEYMFTIRNFEKIFLFLVLIISLFGSLKNFFALDENILIVEMFIIGTTILFVLVETQPRYLLFSMFALILHAALAQHNFK